MRIPEALQWIEQSGNVLAQAKITAMIEATRADDELLDQLAALQNDDGGFPLNGVAGRPSTLNDSCNIIRHFVELEASDHPAVAAASRFILDAQSPRGWWRENSNLAIYSPPLWMDSESDAALIYTTAVCSASLALLDNPEVNVAADKANTWLLGQIANNGLLPGFRVEATGWAMLAAVLLGHRESRPVKRMLGGLGDLLSTDWDAPSLAVMLNGAGIARIPRMTRAVTQAINLLRNLQQPSGAWLNEDGLPDPLLTAWIVRIVRRFGLR